LELETTGGGIDPICGYQKGQHLFVHLPTWDWGEAAALATAAGTANNTLSYGPRAIQAGDVVLT